MMERTFDPDIVREGLDRYPGGGIDINVQGWLDYPLNLAFADPRGNVAMFEYFAKQVYTGHYFFKDRGKFARDLSIQTLRKVFGYYDAALIRGLVPKDNRPSAWMARHLGFKDYGDVEAPSCLCTLFVMTKDEFQERYGNE